MKNYRILVGFMVVLLVAFMSLSAAAHAKDGDSGDRMENLGSGLNILH